MSGSGGGNVIADWSSLVYSPAVDFSSLIKELLVCMCVQVMQCLCAC